MRLTTPTARRPGVTLIEVLVAIFVMALGLMALLTLFPLGALSMAQAIKDERTADEAYNVAAVTRAYWKVALESNPADPDNPIDQAMLNPEPGVMPDRTGNTGPSYPVYVDVFGAPPTGAYAGNWGSWLAQQLYGVPRRSLSGPYLNVQPPYNNTNITLSLFSLLDDLAFQNGTATNPPSREGRYSAALFLRRGNCTESRFVDVTAIVYSGRALEFSPDLSPTGETQYTTAQNPNDPNPNPPHGFVAGNNTVQVVYNGTRPTLRRGDWVMDAWMYDQSGNPQSPFVNEPPHGYFYRVVSVNDVIVNGSPGLELELQNPAKASTPAGSPVLVLDNVVEVFDKPTMGP
jgi:prepilin-type N-terminal cleavage/methylation domain-containing protein